MSYGLRAPTAITPLVALGRDAASLEPVPIRDIQAHQLHFLQEGAGGKPASWRVAEIAPHGAAQTEATSAIARDARRMDVFWIGPDDGLVRASSDTVPRDAWRRLRFSAGPAVAEW